MNLITRYKKDRESLKKLLKGSLKKEFIPDLYNLLVDREISDEVKFLAYTQIRKNEHLFDPQKLSEVLNLPLSAVKKIFKSQLIKVRFPVALNHRGELATAYIIPLEKPVSQNTFSQKKEIQEGLKTIKLVLKNKNLNPQDFFVVFDREFTGKSFMLSVFAGLVLPEEALKQFAFSGVFNEEGEVFDVSYIPEKEKVAQEKGLKLITPQHIDTIDELIYYLGEESIDIPFVFLIKRTQNEGKNALKKLERKIKQQKPFFSLEKLSSIFGIDEEELVVNYGDFLPVLEPQHIDSENQWKEQVKTFENRLKNIYSKLEYKNRVLHLALAIPASLAMAFGIKLGAKKPVVLYHYQSDEYIPVIDLSDKEKLRKIKTIHKSISQLKHIKISTPDEINSKDVAVAVWLASHNLYADVQNYVSYPVIKIESKEFQGNLPLPENDNYSWIEYIAEIYSVLNLLKNEKSISKYHFFLSSPVPIAFGLGMAIGHFWEGIIYNFNLKGEPKYYPVFKTNSSELRSIF